LHSFVTMKFSTNRYRSLLVALILAALAIPLFAASAFAQQDPYFDPSLGVGDSIIRSDVFVGDKQGRVRYRGAVHQADVRLAERCCGSAERTGRARGSGVHR
jgi:hypothetical protein